jgi:ferredoxin
MPRLRAEVARAKCRSFGKCMSVAPEGLAFDEERKARAVAGADVPEETLLKAAKSCPYRAITVLDADSGEQLFPPVRK